MTINERFDAIIKVLFGGNKRAFALHIGVNPTVVENVVGTRKGKPSFDFLEKVCAKANISAEWLLMGKGDMIMDMFEFRKTPMIFHSDPKLYENDLEEISTGDEKPIAHLTESPHEGIPLIPIEAMAGALTSEQTVLEYECERYVVPVFKGADFLIPVKGLSMYPKYNSGDIVACQRVPMSDLFFQWNKVYVIDTTQGPLIKRIKPGSDKEHILIVSDNEKYDPFELPYSAIRAVALVVGVIRLE
jgi:phage repressor protein C with HTH and peptisase S24 domain